MSDDWNPFFERKRKRNRVCRGRPEHPRRYFALPIVYGVILVWIISSIGLSGFRLMGQRAEETANRFYVWATTPSEMERVKTELAQAREVIDYLQRDLIQEKFQRLRLQLELDKSQVRGNVDGIVITNNAIEGVTGTWIANQWGNPISVTRTTQSTRQERKRK